MPSRINLIVALLVAVCALAASAEAYAQSCGQPPDPRTNTSGYASWCSCMGGSYNYQTTACVGATGPRRTYRGSSGTWGCYARASNGAWGNSWSWATEAQARSRAIGECRSNSRGRRCTVRYCQRGTSSARRPGPGRAAPRRTPPKRYAYSCSLCERKLRNDLLSGLGSARIQTYVRQAIAGYNNCKRKGRPPCSRGDILVRSVRNGCFGFRADAPFRRCVGRVLGR